MFRRLFVLLFSPEAPSLCTSCAPDCTFVPLERGALSLPTWKLCHATRIKISSRSSKRGLNIGRERRGGKALRVGMGMGESETESMWESREVEVVKWKSELDSFSNSNSRIQYAHIVPVTVRVISSLSRIVYYLLSIDYCTCGWHTL